MKLLHTSDWHLGKNDGDTSLYDDQIFFIDELCSIVSREKIDAVLIAGDVYDRAVASAEAAKLYSYAMTRLCIECNVCVFVIAGNHDSADRLSVCNALLRKSGLYICGELSEDVSPIKAGNSEIFLLPWISEEKVRSVFPSDKESVCDISSAYRLVTDKMRAQFSPDRRHIILSHAFITNAETSVSDRSAEIGFASQICADVFDGFDYAALGHIHGPQIINSHVRYCGTPIPYSFGKEEKQCKGFVLIDTETMEQSFLPVPLLHRRISIECSLEEALNGKWPDEIKEAYVRLRISDSYVGLETLSELRSAFSNLIEVEGKSFESDSGTVTLSMEQLEEMESDPLEVFRFFCREEMGEEPSEHFSALFRAAVEEAEKETDI